MFNWSLDWLLSWSLGLMTVGALGAAFYHWFYVHYRLSLVFLLYAIVNVLLLGGKYE